MKMTMDQSLLEKKPFRFIVVGSGWRSLFYWRIACAYPELFTMEAMLCRTDEKAGAMRRPYGVPAITSEAACEAMKPDFVVIAVNKASIFSETKRWAKKGYPVLCETPAALKLEDLKELWRMKTEEGAKIQVAEQYYLYPSFAAAMEVVRRGYLGDVTMMNLSAVHDYHGASVIRRMLGTGLQNMTVYGKEYPYTLVETDSRDGAVTDGRRAEKTRRRLTFEFEGGKTAFYDFSSAQYHSYIRSRHLNVQGPEGELDDWIVRRIKEEIQPSGRRFLPMEQTMSVEREASGSGIIRIYLGEEQLYVNPFVHMGLKKVLPQDETAIAVLMMGLRRYIEEGTECYPLAEGLQDAYTLILMEEALKDPGRLVRSETQIWAGKQI